MSFGPAQRRVKGAPNLVGLGKPTLNVQYIERVAPNISDLLLLYLEEPRSKRTKVQFRLLLKFTRKEGSTNKEWSYTIKMFKTLNSFFTFNSTLI